MTWDNLVTTGKKGNNGKRSMFNMIGGDVLDRIGVLVDDVGGLTAGALMYWCIGDWLHMTSIQH